jgi:general secretion pathway protein A
MYEHVFQFFGLRENPFHVSPDPRSYFPRHASDAALAELIHGVEAPQGFIVLTGDAGTGKTTLLNHFLDWLRERQRSSSYVFHPRLRPLELFEFILRDFDVPCEKRNKRDLLETLRRWLIRRHAIGDSPVVVIDEAQAISLRTLAQLQLLLDLETAGSKLLHVVLAGQPKLEEELLRPELRRLHERVTFRCSLPPFSPGETLHFVESRLASAGATNMDVFAKESLEATHTYARGIPRTVNLLCEHALLTAYAEQVKVISSDLIWRVAAEFDLTSQPAGAEGRELSARFTRLVPLRSETNSGPVAPENAAVDSRKAGTIVAELVTPPKRCRKWYRL